MPEVHSILISMQYDIFFVYKSPSKNSDKILLTSRVHCIFFLIWLMIHPFYVNSAGIKSHNGEMISKNISKIAWRYMSIQHCHHYFWNYWNETQRIQAYKIKECRAWENCSKCDANCSPVVFFIWSNMEVLCRSSCRYYTT